MAVWDFIVVIAVIGYGRHVRIAEKLNGRDRREVTGLLSLSILVSSSCPRANIPDANLS